MKFKLFFNVLFLYFCRFQFEYKQSQVNRLRKQNDSILVQSAIIQVKFKFSTRHFSGYQKKIPPNRFSRKKKNAPVQQ